MILAKTLSLLCLLLGYVCGATAKPSTRSVPRGFVTTKGSHFVLDGEPFVRSQYPFCFMLKIENACQAFVGANSYVGQSDITINAVIDPF